MNVKIIKKTKNPFKIIKMYKQLTKEFGCPLDVIFRAVEDDAMILKDALRKAKIYDSLSNELGCPLEVVFKAFEERYVIFKHVVGVENPIIKLETHKVLGLICVCEKFGLELCDGVFGDEFYVYTKDYGKTWWLKKDRSK